MEWSAAWWHWVLAGIVLLALELLTPGAFFMIFFGAGAVAVGVLSLIGFTGPLWMQVLLFAGLSVAALLGLRRLLISRLRLVAPPRQVDQLVGQTAVAMDDIDVDGVGRVELRGAAWSARNAGRVALRRGERCAVLRVEGLTLWVCEEAGI